MGLTFTKVTLKGADLGPVNPLPDMTPGGDIHSRIDIGKSLTEEEARYMGWGTVHGIAPYPIQDAYDRHPVDREYPAAILENSHLKAVFLPTLGGRLWQLYDKDMKRDLLFTNPVFQPGNLGLRNAWFAGGVEFNIGMTGHTPFTCDKLFTASWKKEDGTEVLRMYEFERIRQVTYCIDAFLPEDSRQLYLSMEIVNTRSEMVPIYWWSNIAAPETPKTRVLVPAEKAFRFGYQSALEKESVPVTESDGFDLSYSMNAPYSLDLFYDIVPPQRPWIAALDEKGRGLIQCSTARLRGRKLFMWGTGSGGNRWQEHLCTAGHRYLEIQAGLAHTQLECLPLPDNAHWRWLECYGAMEADAQVVHGDNYTAAWQHVDGLLNQQTPIAQLDAMLADMERQAPALLPPHDAASGWAALESLRRDEPVNPALRFDGGLGEEQKPWMMLLREGRFPCPDPAKEPCGWMTQAEWLPLLEAALPGSDHWYTHLHLGMLYFAAKDQEKAREHWELSMERTPNAWAARNLAKLMLLQDEKEKAADAYRQALRLAPTQRQLVLEAVEALLSLNQPQAALEATENLPEKLANLGRMRILRARAMMAGGDTLGAKAIMEDKTLSVDDYREGEDSLTGLWKSIAMKMTGLDEKEALEKMPLPAHIDYRMRT